MREWLLVYDGLSVLLGVAASAVVLVLYLKSGAPNLVWCLLSNALVTLVVGALAYDLYCQILGPGHGSRPLAWYTTDYLCLGLCFTVPPMARPQVPTRVTRWGEGLVSGAAGVMGVALTVSHAWRPASGLYPTLYVIIFGLLSLAILYFGVTVYRHRPRETGPRRLRHYHQALTFIGAVSLALLPGFVVTDFFGGLIPGLLPLPSEFNLLPAFLILMSAGVVLAAALEILEPADLPKEPTALDETFVKRYGLTKREAEIAPLIVECLSYQQMADRLFISVGTVRTHLIHIYQKTGVRTRLEFFRLVQSTSSVSSPSK